jgi:hypothetical protein
MTRTLQKLPENQVPKLVFQEIEGQKMQVTFDKGLGSCPVAGT